MKWFCRHRSTQLIEATPQTPWMTKVFGVVVLQERKTIEKVKCRKCGTLFLQKGQQFKRLSNLKPL